MRWLDHSRPTLLLALSVLTLTAGALARHTGAVDLVRYLWGLGVVANGLASTVTMIRSLGRRQLGVDVLALLSMSVALLSGEVLVAAIIALMLASGGALEHFAQSRARRQMTALLARAPPHTTRFEESQWRQVDLDGIRAGDRLLVRPGDAVPVDGTLVTPAELDESTLTGESATRHRVVPDAVQSGVLNAGASFEMVARAGAANSTFSGIVRMVGTALTERSAPARMADRYAVAFVGFALLLAGASWWMSGDARRCLSVLVVATPCPLLLAVPVAIASGMSRCAMRGILIKEGGALERLAQADPRLIDKTGTLTSGCARLADMECDPRFRPETVLSLAGSLAQASSHTSARAIAHQRTGHCPGGPRPGDCAAVARRRH
ncbi:cation transporter [Pandoraea sputorum]|nr:HAD-IC family P-type ATPase [Pandoraea sputorum]VVE58848.1 cation transporter [Pandoraea sputorum]